MASNTIVQVYLRLMWFEGTVHAQVTVDHDNFVPYDISKLPAGPYLLLLKEVDKDYATGHTRTIPIQLTAEGVQPCLRTT